VIPGQPCEARVHQVLLGWDSGYRPDRALAEDLAEAAPWLRRTVRASAAYGQNAVRGLAREGFRVILDLGCGFPAPHRLRTHDLAPAATVVYVDRNPAVAGHWRVLAETPRELWAEADLSAPEELLAHPAVAPALRRAAPVAVLLHEVLPWLDDTQSSSLLLTLAARLPAGSALSVTHVAADTRPEDTARLINVYATAGLAYHPRTLERLQGLLCEAQLMSGPVTGIPLRALSAVGGREPLPGSYALAALTPREATR
jgi:O-methyltransferase involved in polyketide biosynthesis